MATSSCSRLKKKHLNFFYSISNWSPPWQRKRTSHLNIMERIQNTTMNQLSGITQQLKELLSGKRPTKEKADDSYRKKLK